MRERLARFMAGRNGADNLSRAVMLLAFILFILSLFFSDWLAQLLLTLAVTGIVYVYFRMFSKNVARRREENSRYLAKTASLRSYFRSLGERWRQRRDYKFFRCPM